MAHVLRGQQWRCCRQVLLGCSTLPASSATPTRCYSRKYRASEEEKAQLKEYREKLSVLREQYRQQWLAKENQSESTSEQLGEELLMEKKMEKEALERNRLDNERMAREREKIRLENEQIKLSRLETKAAAREAEKIGMIETRNVQVERLQEESAEFITLENLDSKIEEAIENEVNLNFALTPSGNKIV